MEEAKKQNRSVTNYLETTLETLWQEWAKPSSGRDKRNRE